jgi:hypothetical protein
MTPASFVKQFPPTHMLPSYMLDWECMNRLDQDPRVFAADPPPAGPSDQTPSDMSQLRDAYLDKLTDPANGLPALYARLTVLKTCLDSFRPFDPAQVEKLQEAFDTEYTYNSNKIEGNTLTFLETHLVVNKGLTISGKPMRDHTEAINHQEAIDFIRDLAAGAEDMTEFNLEQIHAIILRGIDRANAGVYRSLPVSVGQHIPPAPMHIQSRMNEVFKFYRRAGRAVPREISHCASVHRRQWPHGAIGHEPDSAARRLSDHRHQR